MSKLTIATALLSVLLTTEQGGCGLTPPGDKGTVAPPSEIEIVMEVTSHPTNSHVVVTLDVVDTTGMPAVNLEYGEIYPTQHAERTPYRHFVVRPTSVPITLTVSAILGGKAGDLLGCAIYINGVKRTGIGEVSVANILEGEVGTYVRCDVYLLASGIK